MVIEVMSFGLALLSTAVHRRGLPKNISLYFSGLRVIPMQSVVLLRSRRT